MRAAECACLPVCLSACLSVAEGSRKPKGKKQAKSNTFLSPPPARTHARLARPHALPAPCVETPQIIQTKPGKPASSLAAHHHRYRARAILWITTTIHPSTLPFCDLPPPARLPLFVFTYLPPSFTATRQNPLGRYSPRFSTVSCKSSTTQDLQHGNQHFFSTTQTRHRHSPTRLISIAIFASISSLSLLSSAFFADHQPSLHCQLASSGISAFESITLGCADWQGAPSFIE